MRLHPQVSAADALGWLKTEALSSFGVEDSSDLETALKPLAEAMAALSAVTVPDDLEPRVP
jgi:hypothetical protein